MIRLIACGCFATIVICFATLMVPSCSGSDSGGAGTRDSGGGGLDAGPDAGPEAGPDAGPDGGPDAGPDAGPGNVPDGGPDAGPPCPAIDTSCPKYEDHTATSADRTITFGGDLRFSPACMRIARTQTVTFQGSFLFHPLRQDCGPAEAIDATDVGTTASFTFNVAGIYGYYCANHRGFGMVGAIQVVP